MYNIDESVLKLKIKFEEIRKMDWVKSYRKDFGGIGITFEKLIGNNENTFEIPDYNGIEIKTKRGYSKSSTTLFNFAPEGPHYHETERLKEKFGYPDKELKQYKILNNTISAVEKTKIGINFYFKLKIDRKREKVFLVVFDKYNNLLEKEVYWGFDLLKEKLERKLKYLAFIKALSKKINKEEYFKYYKMNIYKLKDFNSFINLLENGIITISFKIGVFKKGKNKGKIHDHGTSFNIKEADLLKLYNLIN